MSTKKKDKKLQDSIIGVFSNFPTKSFNYKQIASQLKLKDALNKQKIKSILFYIADKNIIKKTARGKYKLNAKNQHFEGYIDITNSGSAYIITNEFNEDVFVRKHNLNKALDGDIVSFYVFPQRSNRKIEGEVLKIIKRKKTRFVGIVEVFNKIAFLLPKDKKMPFDIFIPLILLNNARDGDIAIAEITDWPKKNKNPIGKIIEILGKPGDNETEMHAILAEFELPYKFPSELEKQVEFIPVQIPDNEIKKRIDFRTATTFTIDPTDAKDFDDALSFQFLPNGNYQIGIHIADVSHYVKKNQPLDKEAYKRATSIYLVDRTIPMLPEKLSNNLCSLRPKEDKLCFSVIFKMNNNAEVLDYKIENTIINSDKRFTYDEAQKIIETEKGELKEEVIYLHRLAQKLRKKRFEKGSIDFHRSEVKFNLDEKGKPLGVYLKVSKEANQLIEEFMLLANKTVASHITKISNKHPLTFVYRVHDKPNQEKLNDFNAFIKKFGYKSISQSTQDFTKSFNYLLKEIEGRNEENLIETLAIRSMAKAKYDTKNIGHYGLGFNFYSHFTSPIRRYPDLMVHRLLYDYLQNPKSKNTTEYKEKCKHCSEREQIAANAERASIKYKQVEFMQDKIGKIFRGTISGITNWGIYVVLDENHCEGMIKVNDLKDDFYNFDEKNYCLTGKYHGEKYQLADKIMVRVLDANLYEKHLDFELVTL